MGRKRKTEKCLEGNDPEYQSLIKKFKITNITSRKFIQILTHPSSSFTTTINLEQKDSLDFSLFSTLASYSLAQGHIDKVTSRVVTLIRQHLVDFVTRPPVTPSQSTIWTHYCHHIQRQHGGESVPLLLLNHGTLEGTDLNSNDPNEIQVPTSSAAAAVRREKEEYRKYMLCPKTTGSLLEVFFASMRYDLNCVVLQYIGRLNKIFIYNINPHFPNTIFLLNMGEPERGHWVRLEPLLSKNPNLINPDKLNNPPPPPLVPVGPYKILKRECQTTDNMFLQIEQSIQTKVCDRATSSSPLPLCDLTLFNRLLSGEATMDQFTVCCVENPGSPDNYKIPPPAWLSQTAVSSSSSAPQYELEQLFKARIPPMESNSYSTVCPSQSTGNIGWVTGREQQHILNNITNKLHKTPQQNINGQQHNNSNNLLHSRHWESSGDSLRWQNSRPSTFSHSHSHSSHPSDLDSFLLHNFNFSRVYNNPSVQTAILIGSQFGAPQILIRLEEGGKLTYQAPSTMFMRILSPEGICLQFYDFTRKQWLPSEMKTQDFTIDPHHCFRLDNTTCQVMHIRCAWFSTPCDPSSSSSSLKNPFDPN